MPRTAKTGIRRVRASPKYPRSGNSIPAALNGEAHPMHPNGGSVAAIKASEYPSSFSFGQAATRHQGAQSKALATTTRAMAEASGSSKNREHTETRGHDAARKYVVETPAHPASDV
jgi:hypothetical protein